MKKKYEKGKKKEVSVEDIIKSLLDPNGKSPIPDDPDFKLSLEQLQQLRTFFRDNFGASAEKYIRIIDKYQYTNPDLPVYADKEDIKEGDYFSLYYAKSEGALDHFLLKIDHEEDNTLEQYKEKFYWFGFLCGTGTIDSENYLISVEFEAQDIDHVTKFIKILGCDKKFQVYTKRDKTTGNKTKMARIEFNSRLMVEDLEQLGWFGPDSRVKKLPPVVNTLIQHSKHICQTLKVDWKEVNAGKLALTWLLGFYDATGTYHRDMNAEIRQEGEVGKNLLLQIKDAYGIENNVETKDFDNSN